jgi:hypothetical protein
VYAGLWDDPAESADLIGSPGSAGSAVPDAPGVTRAGASAAEAPLSQRLSGIDENGRELALHGVALERRVLHLEDLLDGQQLESVAQRRQLERYEGFFRQVLDLFDLLWESNRALIALAAVAPKSSAPSCTGRTTRVSSERVGNRARPQPAGRVCGNGRH